MLIPFSSSNKCNSISTIGTGKGGQLQSRKSPFETYDRRYRGSNWEGRY